MKPVELGKRAFSLQGLVGRQDQMKVIRRQPEMQKANQGEAWNKNQGMGVFLIQSKSIIQLFK